MTRIMFDSTTAKDLPAGAPLLLAYVDGINTHDNYNQVRALHPHALIVKCTVTGGTLDAQVGDIENGDMTPESGVRWAERKLAARQHPTLYMNVSTWAAVKAEVHRRGLDGQVFYLVAGYDNRAVIPAGAIGKQYIDHGPHGEHYDISVVADYWPGVDPAPAPLLTVPWWWHRPLRPGMSGVDVLACKRRLRRLGLGGMTMSPSFGPALEADVKRFQSQHHLPVTGAVDRATAHAIRVA